MAIQLADPTSIPHDWRTRQPGLALWLLIAIPRTLLVLLFYSIYYIPRCLRQNSHWTYRQAFLAQLVKTIFGGPVTECGYTQTLDLEAGDTGEQWVVLNLPSPNFYRGPFAGTSTVKPEVIGGTWYPGVPSTTTIANDESLVVLSFHSGSFLWSTGRPADSGFAAEMLIKALGGPGTCAFWPQYRLAGGAGKDSATYPAPMQDAITAYIYLVRDMRISPRRIVLAGDSSGGTIAMALIRYLNSLAPGEAKEGGGFDLAALPPPRACLLFSPSLDYSLEGDVRTAVHSPNGKTDYTTGRMMAWGAAAFAPAQIIRLDNPYLSPALHPFATRVPLFVQAGGCEVLCDSIRGFAAAMRGVEGNRVEYLEVEGVPHDVYLVGAFLGWREEQRAVIDAAKNFVKTIDPYVE
jgi:acetyl esterase/lipase